MTRVSFVIPVYNSERSIAAIVDGLYTLYTHTVYRTDVILVNDGSVDHSDDICRKIAKKYPNVTYICLSRNFGQHNALLTGIRYAKGEYVVCLDDDMETPPKESKKLLHAIRQTHQDVVYGQYQRNSSWLRALGSSMNNITGHLCIFRDWYSALQDQLVVSRFTADAGRTDHRIIL
jgi:glycosyltransferase involved in cell wall biosynthesis